MSESVIPLTAEFFETSLRDTLTEYRDVIPYRNDLLFTEFLPRGYRMTTLSCVPDHHLQRVLLIKWNLGAFITLLDDFADNPELRNKELLERLYRVPFDDEFIDYERCSEIERKICILALKLRANMKANIQNLPGFLPFYDVFKFDFEQVMRANQYSELITDYPDIINPAESTQYGAYNMGMVLAGMIDLMSCHPVLSDPLGTLREIFILGQRHGRLSNVLATMNREREEDDGTNEIVALSRFHGTSLEDERANAEQEQEEIIAKLSAVELTQFDGPRFVEGIRKLQQLHQSLVGKI